MTPKELAERLREKTWVPPEVARQAYMIHAQAVEADADAAIALIERLATDDRMRRVWKELVRKNRGTGGFMHPAELPLGIAPLGLLPPTADTVQTTAMGLLLRMAFRFAISGVRTITKTEVGALRRPYLERSKELRADARRLLYGGNQPTVNMIDQAHRMIGAAIAYEGIAAAAAPADDDLLVVHRDTGDAAVRGYTVCVGETCREIFGTLLRGTVAIIVTVALDLDPEITARNVKGWCRAPGG